MNPRLRSQVIAEWRGLPEPRQRPDRTRAVSDLIVGIVKSLGLSERVRQEEIISTWREIVGDFIAAHAQPTRLQHGSLIIQVLQPTMHYELDRVWKTRILEKLRERFGSRTIREIRFRIG